LRRDLTILRCADTRHGAFRQKVSDAAAILAYEAMRGVEVEERRVQTPLEEATGYEVADRVVVVPILRAGLGLMNGFIRFVPEARVGHLGMQRNEETHEPEGYYAKLPDSLSEAHVFVVDPMLATGGSATRAIGALKEEGAQRLTFACLVAAPEGVEALGEAHPDVPVVTAALDRELDENAFIRPGLGDAGDRIYGT
jgi:uracil phosphoribosyltransferase